MRTETQLSKNVKFRLFQTKTVGVHYKGLMPEDRSQVVRSGELGQPSELEAGDP